MGGKQGSNVSIPDKEYDIHNILHEIIMGDEVKDRWHKLEDIASFSNASVDILQDRIKFTKYVSYLNLICAKLTSIEYFLISNVVIKEKEHPNSVRRLGVLMMLVRFMVTLITFLENTRGMSKIDMTKDVLEEAQKLTKNMVHDDWLERPGVLQDRFHRMLGSSVKLFAVYWSAYYINKYQDSKETLEPEYMFTLQSGGSKDYFPGKSASMIQWRKNIFRSKVLIFIFNNGMKNRPHSSNEIIEVVSGLTIEEMLTASEVDTAWRNVVGYTILTCDSLRDAIIGVFDSANVNDDTRANNQFHKVLVRYYGFHLGDGTVVDDMGCVAKLNDFSHKGRYFKIKELDVERLYIYGPDKNSADRVRQIKEECIRDYKLNSGNNSTNKLKADWLY